MLYFWQAALLGVVEGLTEFLPISSTAHLILAANLLRLEQTNFLKSFEIIIQLGAIFSVLVIYWRSFLDYQVLKRLVIAFMPTGLIGLLLYKFAKQYLLGNTDVVLWSLFLGGLFLIIFESFYSRSFSASAPSGQQIGQLSIRQCLTIGTFQAVAIVPGVSRSAATIVGGLLLGLDRKTIVEFSFLLAVPTMLAATLLDISKNLQQFTSDQISVLLIGFATSFIVALASIKWLLGYVQNHDFKAFGAYRVLLSSLFFIGK